MNKKLLSQHALKWNPFLPEVPVEALFLTSPIDSFCKRVETLAREGGFALLTGDPGTGKSVALRILAARLARIRDLRTGILSRPQSGMADFYREMGDLFSVPLTPHNRWGGTKVLRERWQTHLETTLHRPVLIVDEAQEMPPAVLNEMRLLSSVELDSHLLLTVVLAGDSRLTAKFRSDDLQPLESRMRVRLHLDPASSKDLASCLRHAMDAAGNAQLMTEPLIRTLSEHAAGNYRALMSAAAELLAAAAQRDVAQIDEKLFFEVFSTPVSAQRELSAASRARRNRG